MPDFDEVIPRRGTGSVKWNVPESVLPMWVADMDFQASEPIVSTLKKKVAEGCYGYTEVDEEWKEAITSWFSRRHGAFVDPSWILFSLGVIPSLSSLIRRFSHPGEKVVLMTPVYDIFFHSVENNGRKVVESPLLLKEGRYEIDFSDLEEKLSAPDTPLLILCNPHNPVGRVWRKEELSKIARIAQRSHALVISDEIHGDLTRPGFSYTPFFSLSDRSRSLSITLTSPTKAFNLAGIHTSEIICPDPALREEVFRSINNDEIAEPNALSLEATKAAYRFSEGWLDALLAYLEGNRKIAEDFLRKRCPKVLPIRAEATYLLWLDCRKVAADADGFQAFLKEEAGLLVNAGSAYRGDGKGFLRMNLACPKKTLEEGLKRFEKGLSDYLRRSAGL